MRAGSCPGRVGLSQENGESLLAFSPSAGLRPGRLPSCSSWAGSTPCLQHGLEHPQHTWSARAHLGSSTAQQAAAHVSPHSPQHKAKIYTSILLTCSQVIPCCFQPFFALTIFFQLLGPIADKLLYS